MLDFFVEQSRRRGPSLETLFQEKIDPVFSVKKFGHRNFSVAREEILL